MRKVLIEIVPMKMKARKDFSIKVSLKMKKVLMKIAKMKIK